MTWKRSTALPPNASMHARSLPATSNLRFSYFSNALPKANCLPFMTMLATLRRRALYMPEQLVSIVSSGFIGSVSSFTPLSSTRKPFTRCCTSASSVLVACNVVSTPCTLVISSFIFILPEVLLTSSAERSTACTLPSSSFIAASKVSLSFDSASLRSATRAWRAALSASSRFFRSSGVIFFSRPRSSWRAMPMAVFNCWNLPSSRPLAPGATSWWKMRSRFSSGMVKLYSFLEKSSTSARER
mmetsp:Transcript_28665/g.91349  ORF Transcript_28665/g.91349 Transcript_28665/m.91349 type:complete len:243 (+) Transcript_28665:1188-1916(+)